MEQVVYFGDLNKAFALSSIYGMLGQRHSDAVLCDPDFKLKWYQNDLLNNTRELVDEIKLSFLRQNLYSDFAIRSELNAMFGRSDRPKLEEVYPVHCSHDISQKTGTWRWDGERWVLSVRGVSSTLVLKTKNGPQVIVDGHPVVGNKFSRNVPFRNRSQRRKNNESFSVQVN